MATRMLRFRLYRVLGLTSGFEVDALLASIQARAPEDRRMAAGANYVRIKEYTHRDAIRLGRMQKLRMDADAATDFTDTDDERTIQLEANQGLREQAFFLYHPATRVLAYQDNRMVVDHVGFARYLNDVGTPHEEITLEPLIAPDVYEALRRRPYVRSFEVSASMPSQGDFYHGRNAALAAAGAMMQAVGSARLNATLSANVRGGRRLSAQPIVDMVREVLGMPDADRKAKLQRLRLVVGDVGEGDTERIDVLDSSQELQIKAEIHRRQVSLTDVQRQLQEAYEGIRLTMEDRFGREG